MTASSDIVASAASLRKKGLNIIPVHGGSKIQAGTPDEIERWKKSFCDKKIEPHQNIGIQYGEFSGFWALDLDSFGLLEQLITEKQNRNKMMIVKTSRGHHVIFKIKTGDVPPGDIKLFDGIEDKKVTEKNIMKIRMIKNCTVLQGSHSMRLIYASEDIRSAHPVSM